jgi:hypothetical protein
MKRQVRSPWGYTGICRGNPATAKEHLMETTEKKIPVLEKNTLPALKKFLVAVAGACGATEKVGKPKGGHDGRGDQYATIDFRIDGHHDVEFSLFAYGDTDIRVTRSVQDGHGFFGFTMLDPRYQQDFKSTESAMEWVKGHCTIVPEDDHLTKIGRQA